MRVQYIELLGRKYPMCFSLAAIARVEEEFGGMEEMQEALTYREERGLGAVIEASETMLSILMDAGRTYARAIGEEVPPPLPCGVMDVLSADLSDVKDLIADTISASCEREVEADAKNGEATPPEEEAERRGSISPDIRQD